MTNMQTNKHCGLDSLVGIYLFPQNLKKETKKIYLHQIYSIRKINT